MSEQRASGETAVGGASYDAETAAFVERFASDLVEAGMQRMAARVFACLLASPESALSATQLAERLQVSPAAISGAVRYLAQMALLGRERQPGSRRELYRLHHEVWFEAMTRREVLLDRWMGTIRTGIHAVGEESPAHRRLTETEEFLAYLRHEFADIFRRWRSRGSGVEGSPVEDAGEADPAGAAEEAGGGTAGNGSPETTEDAAGETGGKPGGRA